MKVANRLESRGYSRRDFLKAGGGVLLGAYTIGLAGCGGGSQSGSGEMTFQTWAGPAEEEGFRRIVQRFNEQNPEANVKLEIVPFEQQYEKLDTRLAAGSAPDLVRIQYQQMGRYASEGTLVDLTEYVPSGYPDVFAPAFRQSVTFEDGFYGVPQHTDGWAIYYNVGMFDEVGIEPPKVLEESWTWEEFIEVANRIKDSGVADYAFAPDWQGDPNAYRWMPFLFQHGGQLLNDDQSGPQIDNPIGVEAIEYAQMWYQDELVPPSTSIKSGAAVETLFANRTTAMVFHGDYLMPFLEDNMKDEWDATFMIQDVARATQLGGNAVAATKDADDPELAAKFLEFLANEQNMAEFCELAQFVPVREAMMGQTLDYQLRPETMKLFVEQSTTVPTRMAREQTIPEFSEMSQVLADELEAAFKTGQSATATAKNISDGIGEILG